MEFSEPIPHMEVSYHRVQDLEDMCVAGQGKLPPPLYCELTKQALRDKSPAADPELVDHAVLVVAAFHTATACEMMFGIATFISRRG